MNLTYSQIKDLILGAEEVVETELGLCPYRFNEEEIAAYTDPERLGNKCFSSAGIRIAMKTDASALTLGVHLESGSSRGFFAIELFEDGERSGVLKNYTDEMDFEARKACTGQGEYEKTFPLKAGEKQVEVYLPWTFSTTITHLELEDATLVAPIQREKLLLMYGDSITQGYDAYLPSHSYSNCLADALGMQVINKAIGGEVYYPRLAGCTPTQAPDLITVAYGTNDFSKSPYETFLADSRAFYETLARQHPDTTILAISPIWRKDWESDRKIASFFDVEKQLLALAEEIPQLHVIPGFELIPQDTALYSDLRLHPNDDGFAYYAENLIPAVKKYL